MSCPRFSSTGSSPASGGRSRSASKRRRSAGCRTTNGRASRTKLARCSPSSTDVTGRSTRAGSRIGGTSSPRPRSAWSAGPSALKPDPRTQRSGGAAKAPPLRVNEGPSNGRGVPGLLEGVGRRALDLPEHLPRRRAEDPTLCLRRRERHADGGADSQRDSADGQRALLHHVLRLTGKTLGTTAELAGDAACHIADIGGAPAELVGDVTDLVADASGLHLITGHLAAARPLVRAAVAGVPALGVHAIARPSARAPVVHRSVLVHPAIGAVGPEPRDADAGHRGGDRVLLDRLEDAAACLLDG